MRIRLFAAASVFAALIAAGPASAVTPAAISIDINVVLSGDLKASTTRGSFSATGAVVAAGTGSGSGRFAGLGHLRTGEPNSLHATMMLTGADGTLELHLVGLFGHLPAPLADGDGRWVISRGTGAYAELHGRGTWSAEADFRDAMAMTGPPRVAFELTGFVN